MAKSTKLDVPANVFIVLSFAPEIVIITIIAIVRIVIVIVCFNSNSNSNSNSIVGSKKQAPWTAG